MPDWLIWFGAIWLLCSVGSRRSCGVTRHGRMGRVGAMRQGATTFPSRPRQGDHARDARPTSRPTARPARPARPAPHARPETAEERLRRQFVDGRLTLDEYETALWRELRPGRSDEPDRTAR